MKQPGPFLEVVSSGEVDPELERLFAAARAAVDPAAESRARVTSAVAAAVARSGPPGVGVPNALPVSVTPHTVRASAKWLVASAALTLALGFWLGHGVGRSEGRREAAAAASTTQHDAERASGALATGALVNDGRSNAARSNEAGANEPGANEARANDVGEGSALDADHRSRSELGARERPSRASSPLPARPQTRATKAPDPASTATLSFREVLEQLRRARAQLDAGQATMSLLVLSELDRNAGQLLLEEREATRVLALCAAGQDKAARAAADRLRANSPHSIYAMRLESSCVADDASAGSANGAAANTR